MLAVAAAAAAAALSPDQQLIRQHVASLANSTFRQPSGELKYPYLVPGGPYNESWEVDAAQQYLRRYLAL